MAHSAARKSQNLEVTSYILSCRTFCHGNTGWRRKQEPTKRSTKDSSTTVVFRNAASKYKAPITSLRHHNEDSDNGAVDSV